MYAVDTYPTTMFDRANGPVVYTIGVALPHSSDRPPDVDKLREALAAVAREKLPRIATRCVQQGKEIVFQVPKHINASQDFCGFSAGIHSNDPLPLGVLPAPSASLGLNRPAVVLDDSTAARYFRGPDCPTSSSAFFKTNAPALHAHVGVYNRAILIGMTVVHVAFDAEGIAQILRAWAAATRGELDSIKPSPREYTPLNKPALKALAAKLGQVDIKGREDGMLFLNLWGVFVFVILYLWKLLLYGWPTTVILRIPKNWVQQQKEMAISEAVASGSSFTDSRTRIVVSSNDIVTATMLKIGYAHRRKDSTTVIPSMAVSIRTLHPELFPEPSLNNGVMVVTCPRMTASDIASAPVSTTALRFRRILTDYRCSPTVGELVHYAELGDKNPGRMWFPVRPGNDFLLFTSWLSSHFLDLEFALDCGDGNKTVARPIYAACHMINRPLDHGVIVCDDDEAYWVTWRTGKRALRKIRVALQGREDFPVDLL